MAAEPADAAATRGCFVYVVLASDSSLYTGISSDPERRVLEHNASPRGAKALRGKRPVQLVRCWLCPTRSAALRLEAEIKRLRAREKWSLILGNDSDRAPTSAGHPSATSALNH